MSGLACNSCNKDFEDDAEQKFHYKSEWHRYNLKRKIAGVPGVTEALFEARQAAIAQEKVKAVEAPMLYSCGICNKGYRSSKAHEQHLKSKSHVLKASTSTGEEDKAIIKQLPPRRVEKNNTAQLQRPLGKQPGKEHLELPPVVVARYGNDPNKRTILVYGHYDVQPALKEDGWATEPFELTIDEKGRMYGRGSTDDKGPVLGWLNVIEAHKKAGVEFPVNLLCCFEGMEEYGSEGLDDFIHAESKKFFKDADAVCISDNYWLGTEKPCLTYGLRGCNYYSISVSGPAQDLHSGVFGGSAHEPMTDLVHVMSKLVDSQGNILIPGLMDLVEPVTEEEKSLYGNISYTMENLHESLGAETGIHPNKERTLMARWRFPSLSIHGIEGAFSAPGAKTVIPAKVIGKFSIRTVPNMESPDVNKLVFDYVKAEFAKLNSKNTLDVSLQHDGKWWVASPKHWNFSAASKAAKQVFGVEPDMTREGGSIPVTLTFEQATGKNVLLLPMGSSTDAAHSANEKLDRRNYIEGTKLLGAYLHYVAEEPATA